MSKGWGLLWQDPHLLLIGRADVGLPGALSLAHPSPVPMGNGGCSLPALPRGRAPRCSRRRDRGGLAGVSESPCPQLSAGGFDPPTPSTTTPSGPACPPAPADFVTGASLLVRCSIRAPALLPLLARTDWQHLLQTAAVLGRCPGTGAPTPLPPGAHGPPQGPPAWPRGLPKSRGCGREE